MNILTSVELVSQNCEMDRKKIDSLTLQDMGLLTIGRREDNIKMDLREVGRGCGDWMELAQDRDRWRALASTVMNFRVP
jgi:hypothetical protein